MLAKRTVHRIAFCAALISMAILPSSALAQRGERGSGGRGGGGGEMRSGGGNRGPSGGQGYRGGGQNRGRGDFDRGGGGRGNAEAYRGRGEINRGSVNEAPRRGDTRPGADVRGGSDRDRSRDSWQGDRDRGGNYRGDYNDFNRGRYGYTYPGGRYPNYGSRYGYGGYGGYRSFNSFPWYLLGAYGRGYPYGGYGLGGYSYFQGGQYPYYGYYGYNTPQRIYTGRIDTEPSVIAPSSGEDFEQLARDAFRTRDYSEAARFINHALVESPQNGRLYLFAAQATFALGEYEVSAALIHQAATLMEPSELGNIVENYAQYYQGRDYIDQTNRLIEFINENPTSSSALFVRGFQYGFLGYHEPAVKDLTRAYELENRDLLAARLIELFGGQAPPPGENATAPEALPSVNQSQAPPAAPADQPAELAPPVISP